MLYTPMPKIFLTYTQKIENLFLMFLFNIKFQYIFSEYCGVIFYHSQGCVQELMIPNFLADDSNLPR
jgi:hypothetical protein